MDYKDLYLNTFNKKMTEIDLEVISQIKRFKERNKNFSAVANEIEKDLREKENIIKTSIQYNIPELFDRYKNRFNEYDSDHLTFYFKYNFQDFEEKHSDQSLEDCAVELGMFESYSRAAVNFSNSYNFLEAIYVLDKNYEHYTLNFDGNSNPIDSDLFYAMQKERFTNYSNDTSWENLAVKELNSNRSEKLTSKKKDSEQKKDHLPKSTKVSENKNVIEDEIEAIDTKVKLYLLRQLYFLPKPIQEYFSLPELMKLFKVRELSFDTSIFEKRPADTSAYRPINAGLKYYTKNSTREKIKSDAVKYLNHYGLTRFKEYITFHAK